MDTPVISTVLGILLNTKEGRKPTEWAKWNPGVDNENQTLGSAYRTLPRYEFSSYPMIVRALENPKSPIALKGKCDLLTHDLIHILLGRGLLLQDEAFVIGYTMGTSRSIGGFEKELFKKCAHRLYPPKYRFTQTDLAVYDLGFAAGQSNRIEIFKIALAEMLGRQIGDIRRDLTINVDLLKSFYAIERTMFNTKASARLLNVGEASWRG
jgi:hypothetical protein